MTEPARAVFLSYASQDAEPARRICEALRAAGIEVWFDQSELRGGDAWDQKIRKQLHDCALFMPIISANTASRREGYFRLEWGLAEQRAAMIARNMAFIVPVCVDSTSETSEDVPESFLRVQWTRLPGGKTPVSFGQRVAALLAGTAKVSPTPVNRPPASAAAQPRRFGLWLAVGAVGLVLVGAIVWQSWRLMTPKPVVLPTPSNVAVNASAAVPEKSIAVLPFVDMSEKRDQEYFGDGMAEEILNLLVKIPELRVIGRTSSFHFKGKTEDLRAIGTALGAAYVVEGSVRRSGKHMRVTAQLIGTRDGAHRWSETYDRDASDVLKVQGEIAGSLVRALQLEVANPLVFQSRSSLRSGEAYDMYLRGLHAKDRFDQRGFEEAAAGFRRALELDPLLSPAAETLALDLLNLASLGFVPPQIGFEQARVAAEAALKLDSKSALAHAVLGGIHVFHDWDWPAAAREVETAVALAPNSPSVLDIAAIERMAVGRWSEAANFLDASSTLDPLDPVVHRFSSWVYLRLGRFAEAESAARRTLDISPTFAWGRSWLGVVLLVEGKTQEALAEMKKETSVSRRMAGLAVAYQALHRTKDADAALVRLEV